MLQIWRNVGNGQALNDLIVMTGRCQIALAD
jgi:hypothetical protein